MPLGVNRHDDRLGPKSRCNPSNQIRLRKRGGIDADLVRPRCKDRGRLLQRANASAHRERNKQFACRSAHRIEQCGTTLVRRRDIKQHDFVGSQRTMRLCQFGRIARIAQVLELHAFHNASALHVQASDNAFSQHVRAHKSFPATSAQPLRTFQDETARRTDVPSRLPRKTVRHIHSMPPWPQSSARETNA